MPVSFFPRYLRLTLALSGLAALAGLGLGAAPAFAGDTTPAAQLARFNAEAGAPGSAARGQAFFEATHGGEWSCASCHGKPPTAVGKHASTGKAIQPLAPAFDAKRFTEVAQVDKWFRRNCKDVLSRECSATEKADVMAYLVGLK
jgi:cytochrome c553